MTRDHVGYLIRNKGTSVHVTRPGETFPAFEAPTVAEALAMIEIDRNRGEEAAIRCPGCAHDDCECLA